MVERDSAIDPKPIISFMFAISVGFWAKELAQYISVLKETGKITGQQCVILVSGVLFLLDILCILWWYARYIYRVQPKAKFGAYFLDFVICSMFALAASSWIEPITFLLATTLGTTLLIWRFRLLYKSADVSWTDRQILSKAFKMFRVALLIAVVGILASTLILTEFISDKNNYLDCILPTLVCVMSFIGIYLTLSLKTKIEVAVAIYLARHAPVTPAHLVWPALKKGEEEKIREQRDRVRQGVKAGLEDFEKLFNQFGNKHDRIHSRVHSETELRVQSYILALPSCEKQDYAEEIEEKAFMVAASHWLDDLVDGRNEVRVCEQLKNGSKSINEVLGNSKDIDSTKVEELFEQIYRPLIIKHTDHDFYDELYDKIIKSCTQETNIKYMLLGLIRVAYGSVIFSPKIPNKERWEILNKSHNVFMKQWNNQKTGALEQEVKSILSELAVGDESEAGPILLGLTTKTVQEVAMSNEENDLNVSLSILFSILYAPLVYYHNIQQEMENDEMIPLQAFNTDSDLWIPWLATTRKAIDDFDTSDRKQMRIKQIEMAYKCFEPKLPEFVRPELREIYLRGSEDVNPAP